jgi:hypothetical protein
MIANLNSNSILLQINFPKLLIFLSFPFELLKGWFEEMLEL